MIRLASTPTGEHALATALETSILALKAPNFKLKWHLSYEMMTVNANDKNKNERSALTTCVLPTSPDTHSRMLTRYVFLYYIYIVVSLLIAFRWCTEEVYVSEFVDMLCQYFSIMNEVTIEKWGTEALEWARGYRVMIIIIIITIK